MNRHGTYKSSGFLEFTMTPWPCASYYFHFYYCRPIFNIKKYAYLYTIFTKKDTSNK